MLATQMSMFSLQAELLWPFFHAESSKKELHRDYALTRCKFQIDYLLHEVHPELERWLPRLHGDEIPKWLDRANPRRSLDRITAMLLHLETLLKTHDLHNPLYFGDPGRRKRATSSALLALHAILHSHARWGARYFHDLESALAAEALLSHYPQWIRLCIVSLVLLKNVFRTAVSKSEWQRESGIWDGQNLSFTTEALFPTLAALTARIWQPNRDGQHALPDELEKEWHPALAAALSLVAQCYDARIGTAGHSNPYQELQEALTAKDRSERSPTPTMPDQRQRNALVVFEFGHYVFDEQTADGRKNIVGELLRPADLASPAGPNQPHVLWVSLSRYWALHHGSRIGEAAANTPSKILACFKEKPAQDQPACLKKSGIKARFHFLDLDSQEPVHQAAAYTVAFGLEDEPAPALWDRLNDVFSKLPEARAKEGREYTGMPSAYVTRALDIMAHIYRDDFLTLRVERPQVSIGSSPLPLADPPKNLIALPKNAPKKQDLQDSVDRENWRCPKLLVARAFAALLLNQRMTFGNTRQLIQIEEQSGGVPEDLNTSVADWLKLAKWIADQDRHEKLLSYLDVYASLPVDDVQPPPPKKGDAGKYVLGIDIGAGDVKITAYEYRDGHREPLGAAIFNTDFPVAKPNGGTGRAQYACLAEFVQQLDRAAGEKSPKGNSLSWEAIKGGLAAMGITWPGAVGGELGHERVRAWSKILAAFEGFEFFWDANAQEIHEKFKVREAFARRFFPEDDPRHAPVTLMNDGDAHVLHALDRIRDGVAPAAVHQEVVVLAAGSGTAMGAVDAATERLLDLLAEAGRVIVDIGGPLAETAGKEYPLGTGDTMFSKSTLSNLAEEVLTGWNVTVAGAFIEPLFIGYLLADNAADSVTTKARLELKWKRNPPLKECADSLACALKGDKKPADFAATVAKRMGHNLADLVALTTELFDARVVYAAGGPMSGATGTGVLESAKKELEDRYGFHVVANDERVPGAPHRLARLLKLTLVPAEADELSGAHGAAVRAAELLRQRG